MNNIWFIVSRDNGKPPMITPARDIWSALTGFSFAQKADDVMRIEIREDRTVKVGSGHNERAVHTSEPLFTFTRTGPQEFADKNKNKAWWESAR